MSAFALALAVFSLLVLPGPTNTLLALSAEKLTPGQYTGRLATVMAAYIAVVVPFAWIAGPILQDHVQVAKSVKLASAGWVLYLGFRVWTSEKQFDGATLGNGRLLLTTLLNPKGLMLGLTILPPSPLSLAILTSVVALTSSIWIFAGRAIVGTGSRRRVIARKIGSGVLCLFSVAFAASIWS
ncbi:threonine transporter RhtB [Rhizobium sp. P28RR-XV]|uniref:threonine transporter RhtB n=1 Tax=Rhizobium sp. P28RR-XV TaxID=2726737 RepID=UPI0014570962|nr:threonine transporter RhtB [Rhizobium sp. P28RR-XV]NLR89409.1 threonine transporter RhtB [Rhizobium sp. P28RR-XV]